MRKILLFILPLLFCAFISNAQQKFSNSDASASMQLISASKTSIGLAADDISNLKITNTYVDNTSGIRYVYLIQTYQGIPVYNQMLILAFKNDRLVSKAGVFNRSVEKLANVKSGMPPVTAESAVQSAITDRGLAATQMAIAVNRNEEEHKITFNNMGVSRENITAQLMWVPMEEMVNNVSMVTKVKLAWQVYIIPTTTSDYWLVRIDASSNSPLGNTNLTDYDNWGTPSQENKITENPSFIKGMQNVAFASGNLFDFKQVTKLASEMPDGPTVVTTATYRVIPFPAEAPSFPLGTPATRTDPWTSASGVPNAITLKWHTGLAAADYDYTRGNNVWAYQDQANTNAGTVAKSATSTTAFPNLTFDFVPNFTVAPTQTTPVQNQQFNITNLFYWNNVMHDVMYIYGLTEASANFQDDNMGRGGLGNDHVNAEAQDGSGTNNANFATPADGGSGRMQMYLWTGSPQKDGDVDNSVICHEFGHGISNRFTGGGTAGCLGNAEQMGEGWGDYNALMFTQDWATATLTTGFNSPRGIGTYVLNQPPTGLGIRSQRYCTDFAVNNKVYAAVIPAAPHDRGEIWCATLWDMTWNIINQVGTINPNLYNLAGGGGNTIAFKLVNEGMRLQQCSPGFISGRNAILAADQALYGGTYNCAIWEAFRRRGMGAFASEGSTNSVTDQIPDFTPPITLGATVSAPTIPEGQTLTYTNSVFTCSAVAGYTLRDTLPSNVTWSSGGTYDIPTRVVSFPVTQPAGSTNYPFIVTVNAGSYFPPVTVINEPVAGATIPAIWTETTTLGTPWAVVSTQSHSAPNSFFVVNLPASGDQKLETTASIALPLNSYPKLSFWHAFNTEAGWDGGVVEISTNGGGTWVDLGPNMITNGYNGGLGAAPTNALSGRAAFTGLQSTFINTVISLAPYAGQSVKIRFRFGSDDNTAGPTSPTGWWVDDIVLNYVAAVNMRSSLFNATNTRVSFKDMVTEITQLVACAPVINTQPTSVTTCAASTATFTCVGAATGGVTYQWQESTGGPFTNITNGGVYSGATLSTLTLTGVTLAMNGRQYRCVVTGTCPPDATSNAATLTVVAASIGGTVTPANTSVCGTTNSGTLTLSGHTGAVVRWESSTVGVGGPFTPIANTTTTLTFTNITQTTYYRAVVLVPGCVEAPSSVATVTFIASNPMVIIAVPGTTLCQGDPAALTVYEAGPLVPVTVTHSSSNTITAGTGVSCGTAGVNTAINSYWRAYDLTTFPAIIAPFTINSVNFGIEQLSGGTQLFTVRLYNQTGGAFPGGTRTQIASQTFNIPVQALTVFTATFTTPVTVSNASTIVVEVEKSAVVTGQFFFPGGNAAAETGPSYISAPACAINTPVTYASIGFPNTHLVMALAGTVQGIGGIVTGGTFLWTPAAGLSSTSTNPVAASPAVTTTYTVNHNNGLGCIRQASITLNVNLRPTVTSQPANATICSGQPATFTITGTGTGITYQWQEAIGAGPFVNIPGPGTAPYAGVNTPTLTINPVTAAMSGNRYRCVLSGTCPPNGTANISNAATLTVNGLPGVTITPAGPVCGGVAGINGTQLSTASSAPPVPGTVTVNSATINLAVPDNTANGVSNDITMAGIPANATITNVSITLNMSHTYPGDMIFNLKAPNGQILNLYKYGGGLGTGPVSGVPTWGWYGAKVSQLGTIAWSTVAAAPFIYNNSTAWKADAINTPVVGVTVQNPTGFISAAANFNALYTTGPSANGTWTLAMADGGAGDVGSLASWGITIDYTTPGGTGTPLTYTWSPAGGLYLNSTATIPYIAGTQTPTVYAAPTALTVYTVTGTDGTTGCSNTASVTVNYTPPAPTVTPSAVTMCLGDPAVKLKSASSTSTVVAFNSGTISVPIPDNDQAGASNNITVSGIPANATVTGMRVKMTIPHTFIGDLVIALKAPNSNVLNLDYYLSFSFGGTTTGFSNTIITSAAGAAALSTGTNPYSAQFRPDGQIAATANGPAAPTGYTANMANFGALISSLTPANVNGVYTLAMYDGGAIDIGTLTNWEIEFTYVVGVPATPAVWSPAAGLYSDASASTAYVAGTAVDSVWARPTPSGVYPYTATVQSVSLAPAAPATPMTGGNGNNTVSFNITNSNAIAMTLTGISSNAFAAGAITARAFFKPSAIAGNPGNIDAANGWNQFGPSINSNVTAGALNPVLTGLSLNIPAGATYGIVLEMTGATFPAYTNGTGVVASYTNGGCTISTDGNIGWGGPAAPGPMVNNPRNFNGTVYLSAGSAAACTSPGRTVIVTVNQPTTIAAQPANQIVCTDKVASFTVAAAGTGPFTYQWQVSTDVGNTWTNIANGGVYSGATSATLVITAPPVSMNGYYYRAVVQGAAPCASINSFQRLLTVNPLPAVVITANPYRRLLPGLTTILSSTVTPNAAAAGGYVWLRNGIQVPGAGAGTLNVTVDNLGDYSLRVTDINGCTNTSNVISILDSVSGRCFIYPNPSSGKFQVRYYSALNNVLPRSVIVYDAKGDQILIQSYIVGRPYDRMDVDLRRNGKGVYWVEVVDMNGKRLTMCRVIIQ